MKEEIKFRFDGRVVLITGAASGIGRVAALRIASEGGTVMVDGSTAVAEIEREGGSAAFIRLDVASELSWREAVSATISTLGRLNVLIDNAGIGNIESLEETSVDTWDKVIAVSQTSVFLGMKAAAKALKASGNGAAANISSMYGIIGSGREPAYHAAKGAVRR